MNVGNSNTGREGSNAVTTDGPSNRVLRSASATAAAAAARAAAAAAAAAAALSAASSFESSSIGGGVGGGSGDDEEGEGRGDEIRTSSAAGDLIIHGETFPSRRRPSGNARRDGGTMGGIHRNVQGQVGGRGGGGRSGSNFSSPTHRRRPTPVPTGGSGSLYPEDENIDNSDGSDDNNNDIPDQQQTHQQNQLLQRSQQEPQQHPQDRRDETNQHDEAPDNYNDNIPDDEKEKNHEPEDEHKHKQVEDEVNTKGRSDSPTLHHVTDDGPATAGTTGNTTTSSTRLVHGNTTYPSITVAAVSSTVSATDATAGTTIDTSTTGPTPSLSSSTTTTRGQRPITESYMAHFNETRSSGTGSTGVRPKLPDEEISDRTLMSGMANTNDRIYSHGNSIVPFQNNGRDGRRKKWHQRSGGADVSTSIAANAATPMDFPSPMLWHDDLTALDLPDEHDTNPRQRRRQQSPQQKRQGRSLSPFRIFRRRFGSRGRARGNNNEDEDDNRKGDGKGGGDNDNDHDHAADYGPPRRRFFSQPHRATHSNKFNRGFGRISQYDVDDEGLEDEPNAKRTARDLKQSKGTIRRRFFSPQRSRSAAAATAAGGVGAGATRGLQDLNEYMIPDEADAAASLHRRPRHASTQLFHRQQQQQQQQQQHGKKPTRHLPHLASNDTIVTGNRSSNATTARNRAHPRDELRSFAVPSSIAGGAVPAAAAAAVGGAEYCPDEMKDTDAARATANAFDAVAAAERKKKSKIDKIRELEESNAALRYDRERLRAEVAGLEQSLRAEREEELRLRRLQAAEEEAVGEDRREPSQEQRQQQERKHRGQEEHEGRHIVFNKNSNNNDDNGRVEACMALTSAVFHQLDKIKTERQRHDRTKQELDKLRTKVKHLKKVNKDQKTTIVRLEKEIETGDVEIRCLQQELIRRGGVITPRGGGAGGGLLGLRLASSSHHHSADGGIAGRKSRGSSDITEDGTEATNTTGGAASYSNNNVPREIETVREVDDEEEDSSDDMNEDSPKKTASPAGARKSYLSIFFHEQLARMDDEMRMVKGRNDVLERRAKELERRVEQLEKEKKKQESLRGRGGYEKKEGRHEADTGVRGVTNAADAASGRAQSGRWKGGDRGSAAALSRSRSSPSVRSPSSATALEEMAIAVAATSRGTEEERERINSVGRKLDELMDRNEAQLGILMAEIGTEGSGRGDEVQLQQHLRQNSNDYRRSLVSTTPSSRSLHSGSDVAAGVPPELMDNIPIVNSPATLSS